MNRQTRVAWAAGFFDGEGSVGTPTRRHINISISQVDPRPLAIVKELFGGKIFFHDSAGVRRNGDRWKPQWRYHLSGYQASVALREMLPYLIVKRDSAELAIEMARTMRPTRKGRPSKLSAEETARREDLAGKIRYLNHDKGSKVRVRHDSRG